jgi:hypothetical protein
MQPISPRQHSRWAKQLMRRLDRAAGQINPILFAVAIGLVALYLTCLAAMMVRLPVTHMDVCVSNSPSPDASVGPTDPTNSKE